MARLDQVEDRPDGQSHLHPESDLLLHCVVSVAIAIEFFLLRGADVCRVHHGVIEQVHLEVSKTRDVSNSNCIILLHSIA